MHLGAIGVRYHNRGGEGGGGGVQCPSIVA